MRLIQYRIFAISFALLIVVVSCLKLTPADKQAIAADAVKLAACQIEAHACKMSDAGSATCWRVYDACVFRSGLLDGGAHD